MSTREAKALAYHRWRLFFFFAHLSIHLGALWLLMVSGLSDAFFRASPSEAVYFCMVFLFLSVLSLPLDMASGYALEKSFGLSRQDIRAWTQDHLKKTLLSMAFFVLTASAFFLAVRLWPEDWWLALGAGWFALSAILAIVFPVLIIPLFYKTAPLDDALRAELLEWCRALGYHAMDVREIRFSKKTVKANAALTGFGRTRRVILGDTLLQGFSKEEVKMVLAHEIGHHAHRHLLQGLLLDLVTAVAAFGALRMLAGPVAAWAGTESLGDPRALPALSLMAAVAALVWMPVRNAVSRHHERQADLYAWRRYPSETVFVSLMDRLASTNLSHRAPARWEELLLATHPPIERRIALARAYFARSLAN